MWSELTAPSLPVRADQTCWHNNAGEMGNLESSGPNEPRLFVLRSFTIRTVDLQGEALTKDSSPNARHTSYLRQTRFGNLDGIRALCILAVVWHHTHGVQSWKLAGRGFLGVDMFFVLSGFLIVSRLLREEAATGTVSLRSFYRRRVLRIFPLYYAVLAFAAIWMVAAPHSTSGQDFKDGLGWAAVYLSNWREAPGLLAITWSLACEEQFYIVWPLLQRFLKRQAVWALALLTIINVALQLGVFNGALRGTRFEVARLNVLQVTFTPILFGVGLAYLLHDRRSFVVIDRLVNRPHVTGGLAAACIAIAALPLASIQGLPRLSMHVLMVSLLAAAVLREQGRFSQLVNYKPLAYVGALSYGIYLMHQFVRTGVEKVLGRFDIHEGLVLFLATALATTAVAAASFRGFESRFLKRRQLA
jgi:peptidoglycan/LPS O-acetylase OafA/YrhL